MIRKNALSLLVIVLLVVTAMLALPAASAVSQGPAAAGHTSPILFNDSPLPTPTYAANSNPSGGGNGGG